MIEIFSGNRINKENLIIKKRNSNLEISEKNTSQESTKSITDDDLSNHEKLTNYLKENNIKFNEEFELQELMGTGSESFVYKTLIKKNKRFLTSKMIKREKGQKINLNEYKISQKLKNNNIINTFTTINIKEDELDCIMMEYAKHGNLRDFKTKILKRNTLSESLICFITYNILKGLKYINLCKIAHFDLKPENIVVDELLNFKIIDFSVSLDYRNKESKKIKLPYRGTKHYIPPEVDKRNIINTKELNKIDLYSLGVTLYKLAFDDYPYDLNYEESKQYENIKKEGLKDKQYHYSSHFLDFLNKLLEKDINKRININEALNHYWVKGADILLEEKENLYNTNNFLIELITNHIKRFNEHIEN